MRRSHTLKNAHRSPAPPGGLANEVGPFHGEGSTSVVPQSQTVNVLEASLRNELFEKDREKDRLLDQILSLQAQLIQRPPLSALQELENEKKMLDMILLGTQRENEKMMAELERSKKREKMLEAELKKLCGDNWQSSLNISSDTTNSIIPTYPQNLASSALDGNPNYSMSSLSLSSAPLPPHRPQGRILHTSLTGIPHVDSDEEDEEHDDGVEPGGNDTEPGSRGKLREIALQQEIEAMKKQLEQARLLMLGMDKRLTAREEQLGKVIQRAEVETTGLDAKLRELDLNITASS